MKKLFMSVMALSLLTGCWYQTDYSEENAENRALRQTIEGCTIGYEHENLRECLIRTRLKNSPKTYVTYENADGQSVAVLRCTADPKSGGNPCPVPVVEEVKVEPAPEPAPMPTPEPRPMTRTIIRETIIEEIIDGPECCETVVVREVPIVREVTVEKTVVPEQKERTWWETYQENRLAPVPAPCDCSDPNVTCPECWEK